MNYSLLIKDMFFRLFVLFMIASTAACAKTEALVEAPAVEEATEPSPTPIRSESAIPKFEWPPPKASSTEVIPDAFLRKSEKDSVLFHDIDHVLISALDRCGYSDCSYYAVPGGFAIVTRIEQINKDGTSKPDNIRWSLKTPTISPFSDFSQYLKVLFKGNPGYYRVIVFIFTPYGFSQGSKGPSREIVEGWISNGFNILPAELGTQLYTKAHRCTALIYEFKKSQSVATLLIPGNITGKAHLQRSRLWSILQL